MSKLEDYLVTQAGTSTAVGGRVRDSAIGNFPALGEILLSPNEKFSDLNGINKFDLLLCDGSEFDEGKYPILAGYLGGTTLPDMGSPDHSIPYRIIGDLT